MTECWSVKTWKGKDEGEAQGEDLVGVHACVCVFRRGASRSPPNLVAKQQPCRVAAETEVMSPKMRENTFARHKDAQALSHTCVQSSTHRYSIAQTLTCVSQRKIKSDGNSELTFAVSLRAVNSPLFEMRLSLRHLHTHTYSHSHAHTALCGPGVDGWVWSRVLVVEGDVSGQQ